MSIEFVWLLRHYEQRLNAYVFLTGYHQTCQFCPFVNTKVNLLAGEVNNL